MLSAEGVSRSFGAIRALTDVSFTLGRGQTLVVFGPNGAGKTTLLKLAAGLLRPSSGRIVAQDGRRSVGWLAHQSLLYGALSVEENLRFAARLYGGAPDRRIREVLEQFDLGALAGRLVRTLSRGQAQRAAVARAVVHGPAVLLLDEPFTGLDLTAAEALRGLLTAFGREGRALLLVTHNVDEGVGLATHVAFLVGGRLVALEPRGGRSAPQVAEAYRAAVERGRG
ncbi:MAG: heme ABC exporter ATP-binding protein CcmA [Gemmatimonadales bacterium]